MLGVRWGTVTRATVAKIVAVVICVGLVVVGAYLGGEWLWRQLSNYVVPETPTERKDLVNVFALIAAGVIGFLTALAAIGNLYMSRRNLRQQRDLDERRAQDDALQAYYEQVGDLLTKHKLREREDNEDPVRLLAQAQTLTVLRRVDATRKGDLVRFLSGAKLITGEKPILKLARANLSGTYLRDTDFWGAHLSGADFREADLRGAGLRGADLYRADLRGANLSRGGDLSGPHPFGANLNYADLSDANLSDANLSGALLHGTNLGGATLDGANLEDATVAEEQLEAAFSLEGATMPDGTTHH